MPAADHDHDHDTELDRSRPATSPSLEAGDRASAPPVPDNRVGRAAFGASRAAARSQGAGPLDPDIAAGIDAARGGGQPLDEPVRADMEAHLGADLSAVRVHHDATADTLSRSVQADAFTTGSDIFFKQGGYAPETTAGRGMLAHELTHVVQQATGTAGPGGRVSDPGDRHEVEAKAVGDAVASSPVMTSPAVSSTGPAVDRSAPAGTDVDVARQELAEEEELEE